MKPEEFFGVLVATYEQLVKFRFGELKEIDKLNELASKISRWITDPTKKSSIILYGNVGAGKTTMAHAIAKAIESIKKTLKDSTNPGDRERGPLAMLDRYPTPVVFTAQQISDCASSFKAGQDETYLRISRAPFLIIDDMGCEPVVVKNYGTELTPITDIIYSRYDKNATTMITTNMDRNAVRANYGDRVADRLTEVYEYIAYTNNSFRK